ncbi:MAG: NADP-dependent oxidoreductase [Calditrichales bacterium]|nr:MAG: NADP-dependent oxidoreductase [Calditrichales bacterium]
MKKILLKDRPSGQVSTEQFEIVNDMVPVPGPKEILVRTRYLSVDPYMRNRMNNVESYVAPFEVGAPIHSDGIAEVVESNDPELKVGDLVYGSFAWQEYVIPDLKRTRKIPVDEGISPTYYLSLFGLTGLTAYFGLLDIGQPRSGETVVISAAAGAVGAIAGQIAKIHGCRVIGITGSADKAAHLTNDLGFDAVINYKATPNIRKALRAVSPDRVDIYFDNVGGDISDGVFNWLNNHSRVILCGQIALYNLNRLSMGPRMYPQFLIHRTKLQGFIVYDYVKEFGHAVEHLKQWYREGKLIQRENAIDGFDNLPQAFLGLFSGENTGKQLVRIY